MINKVLRDLAVKVSYKKGTDSKGNDIIKYQSFKNINVELQHEDMHTFAELAGEVINYSLTDIGTEEEYVLVSE